MGRQYGLGGSFYLEYHMRVPPPLGEMLGVHLSVDDKRVSHDMTERAPPCSPGAFSTLYTVCSLTTGPLHLLPEPLSLPLLNVW